MGKVHDTIFAEGRAIDLQADREALRGLAAGDRDAWDARQGPCNCITYQQDTSAAGWPFVRPAGTVEQGEVGVIMTSTFSNASRKSCAIRARTFCPFK